MQKKGAGAASLAEPAPAPGSWDRTVLPTAACCPLPGPPSGCPASAPDGLVLNRLLPRWAGLKNPESSQGRAGVVHPPQPAVGGPRAA